MRSSLILLFCSALASASVLPDPQNLDVQGTNVTDISTEETTSLTLKQDLGWVHTTSWVDRQTGWGYDFVDLAQRFPYDDRTNAILTALNKLHTFDLPSADADQKVPQGKWTASGVTISAADTSGQNDLTYPDVAEVLGGLERWNVDKGHKHWWQRSWKDKSVRFQVKKDRRTVSVEGQLLMQVAASS